MEFLIALPFIVVVFVLLYLFFKNDVNSDSCSSSSDSGSSSFD